MGAEHWWSLVLLLVVIAAPWVGAIAWVLHLGPRGDGTPPRSWGSYMRERASVR